MNIRCPHNTTLTRAMDQLTTACTLPSLLLSGKTPLKVPVNGGSLVQNSWSNDSEGSGSEKLEGLYVNEDPMAAQQHSIMWHSGISVSQPDCRNRR